MFTNEFIIVGCEGRYFIKRLFVIMLFRWKLWSSWRTIGVLDSEGSFILRTYPTKESAQAQIDSIRKEEYAREKKIPLEDVPNPQFYGLTDKELIDRLANIGKNKANESPCEVCNGTREKKVKDNGGNNQRDERPRIRRIYPMPKMF